MKTLSEVNIWVQCYHDSKLNKTITWKLYTNISYEHRHKISQVYIGKLNTNWIHKEGNALWPNYVYSRNEKFVQHLKNNQCDSLY